MAHPTVSAPPLPDDFEFVDDAIAADHAIALELQRFYESQLEQEVEDETIAYSLTLDDVTGDTEAKPPPHCSCCLTDLPFASQRRVVPCGHVYCVACIATRCKMGVRDRSLVPAHCCRKEYPTDYVREVLTPNEYATYERFVDERAWTHTVADRALASDAEYAAAVASHGWKQCPECGVGVEKLSGCNAIKCLRGHWFCWLCAKSPCQCGLPNLELQYYMGQQR